MLEVWWMFCAVHIAHNVSWVKYDQPAQRVALCYRRRNAVHQSHTRHKLCRTSIESHNCHTLPHAEQSRRSYNTLSNAEQCSRATQKLSCT